jgi:L-rhamnonate dehydratase
MYKSTVNYGRKGLAI